MGKDRDGFGMVGMEGLKDSGMTGTAGTRLGEKAVQPPQEVWEGAAVSPTSLGVCAAPEAWLGVSGWPGC